MGQQSHCEGTRFLAGQEILRTLQKPKLHYHVYDSLLLVLSLSDMNPVNNFPSHFFRAHFNIIAPSTPTSTKRSLHFVSSQQDPAWNSLRVRVCHMVRQSGYFIPVRSQLGI